jgi:hypothetical protein
MAKPAPKKIDDLVETFDCEQRSDEWMNLRLGLPTASILKTIVAEGADGEDSKTRTKLMNRLAAEIIFQRPMETFTNQAMDRGNVQEPWALAQYAFTRQVEVKRVGFVRRTMRDPLYGDLVFGCSPDGLVNNDGIVQAKSMQPDLIIALQKSGRFPSEHRWQLHGELWATGRQWADLYISYEDFPIALSYPIKRDEAEIARARKAVELFSFELRELVKFSKQRGGIA